MTGETDKASAFARYVRPKRLGIVAVVVGVLGLWAVPNHQASALGVATVEGSDPPLAFCCSLDELYYSAHGPTANSITVTEPEFGDFVFTDPDVLILGLYPCLEAGVGQMSCSGTGGVTVYGGEGNDRIVFRGHVGGWGSAGARLLGGTGNDVINTTKVAEVDCGLGQRDVAVVPSSVVPRVKNCETIRIR